MRQSDRFKEKDFKKRSNFRYRQLEKSDTLRYLLWLKGALSCIAKSEEGGLVLVILFHPLFVIVK